RCGPVLHPYGWGAYRHPRVRAFAGRAKLGGIRLVAVMVREIEGPVPVSAPPKAPRRRRWGRWILPAYTAVVLVYLVSPILVMIVYSFNNTGFKRVSFRWGGFTLQWYPKVFDKPELTAALK